MKALAGRMHEEQGFTLIELMVVVMILAILIVMGLPTFLGVRARFQDRGAQTDLRNSVLAARILFTDNATFASADAAGLNSIVSTQCYVADATVSVASGTAACVAGAGVGSISVTSTPTLFAAARMSSSTTCFVIKDALAGTKYGTATAANCNATWAATGANVNISTPSAAGW
jgi:prepilin-type N-terminal cleavage/methylation domain-containing protein